MVCESNPYILQMANLSSWKVFHINGKLVMVNGKEYLNLVKVQENPNGKETSCEKNMLL